MRSIHLFRGVAGHQFISEKVGPDTRHEKGVAAQPRDGDGLIGTFAAGNDPEFAAENGLAGRRNPVGPDDQVGIGAADNHNFFHRL